MSRSKKNSPRVNPYAAATASLQRAGDLKPGTNKTTKQGVERDQTTQAQRPANPPNGPSKLASDIAGIAKK